MKKIILLAFALIPFVLNAQITNFSSATGTPQTFISTNLLGEGINAFNVQYNGTTSFNSTNQVGTFINTNTTGNLPKIGKGIVLSTGAFNGTNIANQNYQTSPYLRSLLNSLGQTSSINNVASFTFDFQSSLPQTSISSFDYFFATTEYPSYCTFADAFGFFIDGPYEANGITRYTGNGMDYFESYYGKDIAVIPNSNATPVTVPALCSRVGTIFNGNSFTAGSTFGGYTIDLNTLSIVLLPGKIYKITIAICNYSDQSYNSSVFLSGGSFKAVPIITLEPSVITNNSASLDAIVLPSLGYTINGQGFQWRKKTSDNSESWIDVPINGVQIVYNLEGLIPNTIYEYRGYVNTDDGQTYGDTKIFTTLSNPPASTPAVSYTSNTTNITTNSVTFNGGYINGTGTGATISEKGFEYKTNLIQNWTVVSDPTTTSTSDGATTTKIITGLNSGTYYTVRSYVVSMGGTKHYGSIIPFTTLADFGAPIPVYNNITTNSANVIWNAIDGAESYTLQYKEQETSTWSSEILTTANNRNIILDSLSGNKTYDVRIRSNAPSPNYPSPWNVSSFTTLLTAPVNLTTSNKTISSAVINWDSIAGANNYTIQYKLKSASSWITYPTNPTTNQVQLTGLSLAEYQVKVKANKTTPTSSSDWSSILEFAISNIIATPSGTASNITASSASIAWNTVNGAVSYSFQYKLSSASVWSSEQAVNAESRVVNLTSLDTNSLYDYRIKAIASDNSLNSGWGNFQFRTALGTPIGNVSSITASNASIAWNAINGAVSYSFQYKLSSASNWSSEQAVNADSRIINLTGLDTNSLYDYRIKAIASDSSLNSGWGNYQFRTALVTPIGNVSSITASSASIAWNAVNGAVSYSFQYKLSSASVWSSEQAVNADSRIVNLSGLDTNSLYDYRIKAIASDSSLNSGWGNYQFRTALGTPIGNISSITASSASIAWNNVNGAVSYSFQYKLSSASNWSTTININTSNRSISLDNLNDNAIYNYRVIANALNPEQNSGWGLGEFYTLLKTPVCRIDSVTSSSVSISWDEVNGAIGFVWQIKLKSSSQWSAENNVNISLRNINISNLENNSIYDIRIKSLSNNSNGSERQNVANVSINNNVNSEWGYYEIQTLLTTPNNVSVNNYTNTSVNLIWDSVSGADNYTIQYKEKGNSSWNTLNSTINSQLINGLNHLKEYEAQVKANSTSPVNNSEWSTIIEFKPILATPILNGITNITTNNATISWDSINDAGSYDIEYKLDGAIEWTYGGNSTTFSHTLSSLQQGSDYKVRVKAKAISPNTNHSDWSNDSYFTTTCPKVTNINIPITYADSTSAMINWTAGGTETSWLLKYKVLPSGQWSNEITVNTTPEYRLTNLLSGTMYQVSISTPCQDTISIETTSEFITSATDLIIKDNFTLDLVSKIVNQSNSNLNIIFKVSASPFDGSNLLQPIGDLTNPFTGKIIFVDDFGNEIRNGNVVINNLTIPLFGVVGETTIHNISLTNLNITSTNISTGGLINDAIGTIIRGCSASGNISGNNNTGGLIGSANDAIIDSSNFSGTVTGTNIVGGLVGNHVNCSRITNSSSSANIIGQLEVGGLVGFSNCYVGKSHSTGNITAINMAGGLVGHCNGVIQKSYSTCTIIRSSGNNDLFGGIVGCGFGSEDKAFYQTPVSFGVYNFKGKQSNNPANEPDLQ